MAEEVVKAGDILMMGIDDVTLIRKWRVHKEGILNLLARASETSNKEAVK